MGLPQTRIPVSPAIPIAPAIPAYPLKPSRRPVVAPSGRSSFTVPVPVRRVSPDIPVKDRSLIHGNASVRVTVSVDAYGNVTDARPLDIHSSDEKLLSRHVVEAARLWRFEPARRRNGAPVASEAVVVFHFIGR